MPPDDDLGIGGGDNSTKDTSSKDTNVATVDHEALTKTVTQVLEDSLSPVMGEIGKAIGGLNTKVDGLASEPEVRGGGDTTTTELEEFLAAPDKKIAKMISEAKDKDTPLMKAVVMDRVTTHTKSAKSDFDAEYGAGMYDKHMKDPVEGILKNYPAEYLVGSDGVDSALTQIKGQNIELLMKLREENKAAVDKAKSDYAPVGPGRSSGENKKGASDEEKALLDGFKDAGFEDADEKTYMAMKNIPPTLSAYRKYMEGQKNAR